MRIRLDVESGFLFLFVALSAVAVAQALGFAYPANLLPLVVGIPTLALAVAALAQHWASPASVSTPAAGRGAADDAGAGTGAEPKLRREAGTVGWVIAAGLLMWSLGISAAIPLYVFLYGALVGRLPWTRSALLGLGVGAGVYALFVVGLGLQLAPGWIWRFV